MTSRERVLRSLNQQQIDRAPRDLWVPPAAEHADEVTEINLRFPSDILHLDVRALSGKRGKSAPRETQVSDAWGCAWQLGANGEPISAVGHPLADAAKIPGYELPGDPLDAATLDRLRQGCQGSTRFVLAWSRVRPWERFALVRGTQAAVADLHGAHKEVAPLLAKLHAFAVREIEALCRTDVDGVVLSDDWNPAHGAHLPLRAWRTLFKPFYREYCEILHAHDKFVFLHSAGQIAELLPDLLEVGLDALHAPVLGADLEKYAEKYRGQITFWVDVSPLGLALPTTPACIGEAVVRVRRALDLGRGGVIAQCAWAPGLTVRNVATYFEEWMSPLPALA